MFAKLFLYNRLLGFAAVACGIYYMYLLSDRSFNNACYISEKALSPGVIEEQFGPESRISDYFYQVKERYTQKAVDSGQFQAWLEAKLFDIGLDAYTQNFTFDFPLIFGDQKLRGANVAGVLRAHRAARTEALVLMTPLRPPGGSESHTTGSVALLLALAEFFRRQTYWAKDVVFLFPAMEVVGLQAWLHAHHGESERLLPQIRVAEPPHRSGSVQAAVCLEFADLSFGQPSLHVEGVNGILPNLDLVNTGVRVGDKHGLRFLLHDVQRQPPRALLRMLLRQASGSPASLHGLFLPFDIPAIGVSAPSVRGVQRRHRLGEAARVVEGVWRSLNNLQERFHQSFFFYALPEPQRYVSIGDYMPPMGLLLVGLLLAACDVLARRMFPGDGATPALPSLWPLLRLLSLAFGCGLFAFLAPSYFVRLSAAFRVDPGGGLLLGLGALLLVSAAHPRFFRASSLLACDVDFLRLLVALITGICLGALSLVNFGLAFLSGCLMVPACLLSSSRLPQPLWLLALAFDLAASPLGLLLLGCGLATGSAAASWTCAEYGILQAVAEEALLGSWTYRLFTLVLLPCWLLIWCQLFATDQQQPQAGTASANNDISDD